MACKDLGPDGGVVKVPGGGLLIAGGLAVPANGSSGYSPGCVFHQIDGVAGTVLYVNEGTFASCAFKAVATSTSLASYLPLTGGAMSEGGNIATGTSTGTKIATSANQAIGFYGATPLAQQAGAAQAVLAATLTLTGADTMSAANVTTEIDNLKTLVNELRNTIVALGLIKGAA